MSKGLGKTQRGILDILEDREWHWIEDISNTIYKDELQELLNSPHSLGDEINKCYSMDWSTIRASKSLQKTGLIEYDVWHQFARKDKKFSGREGYNKRIRMLSANQGVQHLKLNNKSYE